MKFIQLFTLILLTSFFFACKQDTKQAATTPPPPAPEAAPPASPKPEVYLFATTVDKLNLRDQPNKTGKVVTQIAEGAFLEGTGEVSANKEDAELRGISYTEPYFKVTSTTPEQHNGWAYGGALQRVYAGSRTTSPDLGKLTQLTSFLKTLNAKKLDSGKKAWDYVTANFSDSKGTLADAAFILLEGFLSRMEREGEFYKMTENFKWADADYEAISDEKFDMNKYPHTKSLAQNGFRLETGEGMIFPIVDWAKLTGFFAQKATPPMKMYLEQELLEQKEKAWDDGGVIIGLDKVAERAFFWEKFNREHPYFLRSEQTLESQRWTKITVINGSDNTPSYDYETKVVNEDYKKVWTDILQKYPGTQLAKDVKTISDLYASEGWKRTKKVEDFITQYIDGMYK